MAGNKLRAKINQVEAKRTIQRINQTNKQKTKTTKTNKQTNNNNNNKKKKQELFHWENQQNS